MHNRYWAEESADKEREKKEKESATVIPTINTAATTTTTSTTGTVLGSDGRERRRYTHTHTHCNMLSLRAFYIGSDSIRISKPASIHFEKDFSLCKYILLSLFTEELLK